jgi:hypothetical protein
MTAPPDPTLPSTRGAALSASELDAREPEDGTEVAEEETLHLTPGWIAVGVVAVALGVAMGFIMSSVWLVR